MFPSASIAVEFAALALAAGRLVLAQGFPAYTSALEELPPWASGNTLQLQLSKDSTNYAIIPLTEDLGLHDSSVALDVIQIDGFLKAVTQDNYRNMTDDLDVAYMSCDESNDNDRDPNEILNGLMSLSPMAIVLYSTSMNWCSLSFDGPLSYTSILSMVDPGEATTVLGHLNETNNGDMVGVSIFGNATSGIDNDGHRGNRSTIAMSVLYSITGVITLLFLAIITTGAVRAHRYPERYGPRRAQGGQPRQSRAKGLARAVLETIPIVKFGDKKPPKPDPDLEMETATTDDRDVTAQRSLPLHGERMSMQAAGGTSLDNISRSERASVSPEESEKQLGCSICTEDFQVGEDVRVLPCDHQYHPNCIDPWLINVSGTCPLCRLDLRPGQSNTCTDSTADGVAGLPPPLALEGEENEVIRTSHRNRLSRVFDVNRLRQATVEEQMEALRQLHEDRINSRAASESTIPYTEAEERQRGEGSRFADKLREKFRILTTSQSPRRREC